MTEIRKEEEQSSVFYSKNPFAVKTDEENRRKTKMVAYDLSSRFISRNARGRGRGEREGFTKK